MNQAAVAAAEPAELFGHPRGLATLFLTEMWERFSYYGMRALLILFMVDGARGGLALTDETAAAIYGLYTAAAYLSALPGGWIADRLWGAQRSILVGGVLIMCGHFVLVFPRVGTFFLGLILVVLGTGLLKPNVSAAVGALYSKGDSRRDSGFTLYYIGINLGATLGQTICGWLALMNWHYGFAAAGVGMLLGLIQFRLTRGTLGQAGVAPAVPPTPKLRTIAWSVVLAVIFVVLALLVAAVTRVVQLDAVLLAKGTAWALFVGGLLYFGSVFVTGRLTADERRRMIVLAVLCLCSVLFWAGFEQAGSSFNLFADRYTDRVVLGFEMPTTWLQNLNPVFILLLAPFFSAFWIALARRHLEPSAPAKFAFGLILLGIGTAVMIGAAALVAAGQQVLPTWLALTYLFHTMGELSLSPVGLSTTTKLAPARFVGQMMGMWFLCTALGLVLAGLFAGRFRADALGEWPGLYTQLALASIGLGVLLLLFAKPLRRLMGSAA
jgi:POT family proton-dependent oligopeptide transporter